MKWLRALSGVALVAAVGCSGCGDDDGTPTGLDGGAPDAGMRPMDGGGGDLADTGQPDHPRFMCGTRQCFVPGESLVDFFVGLGFPAGPSPFSPCCTESEECGVVVTKDAGISCVPKPPSDPVCPDVPVFDAMQPGCCIEDQGVCGDNGAQLGVGCYDPTVGFAPLFGVTPLPCGTDAGSGDGDAGIEDDGGAPTPDPASDPPDEADAGT